MGSLKSGAEGSEREGVRGAGEEGEGEREVGKGGGRKFYPWTTTLAHAHGFQSSLVLAVTEPRSGCSLLKSP